ncbi:MULTISPECIES: AraC family transcriptional regulator [unclassified Pseudomonas]|uniref:AraC family transcriptional regulator n=1 Tax=unclassified Pseudomonas TaxID=196821 RepID=UPI0015A1F738|nr:MULTISPECIES: AraC family transcriptional regulator [unclassified Pseudomonas]NWC77326.1 AraC family transcriptional regulator [Pseudomonas sp. P7759]NWE20100.1 AraC family transcriptional regulator [Pseudomonas sp. P7548]
MTHSSVTPSEFRRLLLSDEHLFLCTDDRTEANRVISTLFGPFRSYAPSGLRDAGPVLVHTVNWGTLNISTVNYGSDVNIEPDDLGGWLIVTTVIAGRIRVVTAGNSYDVVAGATLLTVDEDHSRFEYAAGSTAFKLRIPRRRVESLCWRMIGRQGRRPLKFAVVMDGLQVSWRWLSLLEFVVSTLERGGDRLFREQFAPATEELLMMTLLSCQPHNYPPALAEQATTIAPSQWHRAVAYMEHHISDALTLADIANSASCSIRSLTRTFKEFKGTTAMRYLVELRLDRVHTQLLPGNDSATTIESIASQWGFTHLGIFYQQYKSRFGESPSQTRRTRLSRVDVPTSRA